MSPQSPCLKHCRAISHTAAHPSQQCTLLTATLGPSLQEQPRGLLVPLWEKKSPRGQPHAAADCPAQMWHLISLVTYWPETAMQTPQHKHGIGGEITMCLAEPKLEVLGEQYSWPQSSLPETKVYSKYTQILKCQAPQGSNA